MGMSCSSNVDNIICLFGISVSILVFRTEYSDCTSCWLVLIITMQYTAIFHGCKNDIFQLNFFDHIFAQNID